jgi:ABC-type uncharacterized transport system substrate-binding protein
MTSRRPLRNFCALLCVIAACATQPPISTPLSSGAPEGDSFPADPPRRPGKALVLIAMPDLDSFRAVRRSLIREIQADFDVVTTLVDAKTTPVAFENVLRQRNPACAVLMNNPTVTLYRSYQNQQHGKGRVIPAIIVMSSFLEELRGQLDNATGVAFEVPGVTSFVQLRSIIDRPLRRVGVVHRPAFRRFVQRQADLAAREEITLVAQSVPGDAAPHDVRQALLNLKSAGVDALWVLNDNRLLGDGNFLEEGWLKAIEELGVPVVVGIPALVKPDVRFGTLAVLPDLDALGVQTANLVVEVAAEKWEAKQRPIELPVSTLTFVNMQQTRQRYQLRPGALELIDRKIE